MKRDYVVDLYRVLLRLLPRPVREEDEPEIAEAFRSLWLDARRERRRLRAFVRGFGGLTRAIPLEWWNYLRHPAPRHAPQRRRNVMDGAIWHFRHALRGLLRAPSFTMSTVLLLGLGVGSVTTIFTIVDHVLLRPLAYPHADRLFLVENGSHSGPVFEEFKTFRSVDAWAAAMDDEVSLIGATQPENVRQARISRDFFAVFGARPALGRLFVDDDFRVNESVVLSAGTWLRLFGRDSTIVGRSIIVAGAPVVVIGVLNEGFAPPESQTGSTVDVWRPIDATTPSYFERAARMFSVVGRVAEGATLDEAQAEADAMAMRRAQEFPDFYLDNDLPMPLPIAPLHDATVGRAWSGLGLILGAVTLLLLVACTNVAHLFMARSLSRVPEMAVRRALGARIGSLTTQLMMESLLVGAGGALIGVLLAVLGVRAFLLLSPSALPRSSAMTVDLRVLGFAVTIAATTALLFGLLPALRLIGRDVTGSLQSRSRSGTEGRFAQRVRTGLVVAEVALSIVLVTQAGSLLRSFAKLHAQDLGFRTADIWTLPLRPSRMMDARHGGTSTPAEWARRMEAIRVSLAHVPGVQDATFGVTMPLEFTGGTCCFRTSIKSPGITDELRATIHPVDAGFFSLLEMRLVAGTGWERNEQHVRPYPAVLTESIAIELFGSAAAAIGREIAISFAEINTARVSGVVAPNRYNGPARELNDGVYVPPGAVPASLNRGHFAVRVATSDKGLPARLRAAVWRAEADLPVPMVRPLDEWAGAATARLRFESLMFATFATVALMLVAGGLYGTLLYSVGRRRRELGIRLALGDAPGRLERRVLGQAFRTTLFGGAIGLIGAWGVGKMLQNRLFVTPANDPLVLAGAMAVLLLVTIVASWVPARRAAGTDPMEALRTD